MVKEHHVRVYRSEENLPREEQLAYKIAKVATDPVAVTPEVADMVVNRVIDNASVAIASLNRGPIVAARAQALAHGPSTGGQGAKVFGIGERVSPEWAAWANGVAVGPAPHTPTATRQSPTGEISTWKAHAPAFAGKMAVEAADRAMRGQTSPVPIYEGEDGVIAWMLDGPDASYMVPLPEAGEAKRAILDTYTKEHSAEYQAQAWIDLARKLNREHPEATDPANVKSVLIRTSHHTHYVIGSGANDPQKYDPKASRETLDHSIPYIFTVALQDGAWHHVDSYSPERAGRPDTVDLWQKVSTEEDPEWTRRYHSLNIAEKAFGGSVEITLTDGSVIKDDIAVADAHPLGARPFGRDQYVNKFRTLAAGLVEEAEIERFLAAAERLPELSAGELDQLNITAAPGVIDFAAAPKGLF